jgi:hypothetical protein
MSCKKNREIGFPNRILRDTGTGLFKPDKTGTVPGKPGQMRFLVLEEYVSSNIQGERGKMY